MFGRSKKPASDANPNPPSEPGPPSGPGLTSSPGPEATPGPETTAGSPVAQRDLSGFEPIPGGTPTAAPDADGEVPCTPCEAARRARQFSLNEPPPPPPMTDGDVPTASPAVTTDVNDEGVDLSFEGVGHVYSLNATAGLIWLTIDGRLDIAGIIADLAHETGAPAEQIAPDVRSTIATFAAQGLITITPAP